MSSNPEDTVAVLSSSFETTLAATPPEGEVKSLRADPRVAVVVAIVRLWFCNRKLFSSWPSRMSLRDGLRLVVVVVVAVVVLVDGGGNPVLYEGDGDETGGVIIRFGGLSN